MNRSLTEWSQIIHKSVIEHGWYDDERSFGDIIALCHSELSEALEEFRNNKPLTYCRNEQEHCDEPWKPGEALCGRKPEGIATEMLDCMIRILDWCGKENIDVDALLTAKHEYNQTRPYRHGGKAM